MRVPKRTADMVAMRIPAMKTVRSPNLRRFGFMSNGKETTSPVDHDWDEEGGRKCSKEKGAQN